METCPECGSTDVISLEIGTCDGCYLMECETCYEQFRSDELVGTPDCVCNGQTKDEGAGA